MFKASVITVSDLGSRGLRQDTSGPAVRAMLEDAGQFFFASYRDPNLKKTVENYLSAAAFLKDLQLEDSLASVEHSIVDFGEDEFTQGRLHPMIDVSLRASRFEEEARDPEVGVILFDVVIGYGCHPDPATGLVEGILMARALAKDRIVFVASICGTEADPQDGARQRRILEEAGVVVCDSNAQAARLAAYLLKG